MISWEISVEIISSNYEYLYPLSVVIFGFMYFEPLLLDAYTYRIVIFSWWFSFYLSSFEISRLIPSFFVKIYKFIRSSANQMGWAQNWDQPQVWYLSLNFLWPYFSWLLDVVSFLHIFSSFFIVTKHFLIMSVLVFFLLGILLEVDFLSG